MIITGASLFRYRLPLARPLILKNQSHLFREGLVVHLGNDEGLGGWGEIAPLPGFSHETLTAAEAQTTGVLRAVIGQSIPDTITERDAMLQPLYPSVQCGLSMAMLNPGTTGSARQLRLNALLVGTEDEVLTRAAECVARGYRAVKLKVGTRTLEEDVALVYRVVARLQGKASLRIDANRARTFEQALQFGRLVEACPIEYVEEPLQNALELPLLAKEWSLPIALDESLTEIEPRELRCFDHLRALVLKPTLLGSLTRVESFASALSDASGIMAVVSSAFESPLGLMLLARFAANAGFTAPAGLDTAEWFKESTLVRPLPITDGSIDVSQPLTDADIRMDVLTKVFHG